MLLVSLAVAACARPTPAVSAVPKASTFDEFGAAYCAAWDELFTAIGNPDTGSKSALSGAFEKAGGVAAWQAVFEAARTIVRPADAGSRQCPTVPVGY